MNEAVANTLRQPELLSNFYFYNNGITQICPQFRRNVSQRENLRVPVVRLQKINGGQTARIVQLEAEEVREEIGTAEVLVRISELEGK